MLKGSIPMDVDQQSDQGTSNQAPSQPTQESGTRRFLRAARRRSGDLGRRAAVLAQDPRVITHGLLSTAGAVLTVAGLAVSASAGAPITLPTIAGTSLTGLVETYFAYYGGRALFQFGKRKLSEVQSNATDEQEVQNEEGLVRASKRPRIEAAEIVEENEVSTKRQRDEDIEDIEEKSNKRPRREVITTPVPVAETSVPVAETSVPVAATPASVVEEMPVPAEVTPAPAAEVTPAPAAEVTPAPAAEVTPAPAAEVTPAPAAEVTPAPAAEVTPAPAAEVTPAPAAEVTPAPADETPGTAAETPTIAAGSTRRSLTSRRINPILPKYNSLASGANVTPHPAAGVGQPEIKNAGVKFDM